MGGPAGVVTNGATMPEEPAEMEIPLEEEVDNTLHICSRFYKHNVLHALKHCCSGEQVRSTRAPADFF